MTRGHVMRRDDKRIVRRDPIERVLSRLPRGGPDECWIWPGATNGVGYGVIGRGGKHGSNCYVHRVMYVHAKGPIPDGLVLDHLCRNRACANPNHLEPVTTRTNLLRGVGVTAQAAAKTECSSGHPFDLINTRFAPDGSRQCRACGREEQRRLRATRRDES